MKKILTVLTISLLWSNISFAEVSDEYYEVLYEGCMETAKLKNRSPSVTKRYCICAADYIDKRFTENSLDKILQDSNTKAADNLLVNISSYCNKKVGSYK